MARLRAAASSAQIQNPQIREKNITRTTRAALREKTNTTKEPLHMDVENAKESIKDVGPKRGRAAKKAPGNSDLAVISGGGNSRAQEVAGLSDALANVGGLIPSRKVDTNSRKANGSGRMRDKAMQGDAQTDLVASTTSRSKAATKRGRAPRGLRTDKAIERSEFSISPSPPSSVKKTSGRTEAPRSSLARPGSALKIHSTPVAAESSIMALKNFKRRPRQPSMLAMVQQYHQSQRPRESVGGTSAVAVETEVEDLNVNDIDAALGIDAEEDDFSPEAEGTPAYLKKKSASRTTLPTALESRRIRRVSTASESSQKRKSGAMDESQIREVSTSAKRQKHDNSGARDADVLRTRSGSSPRLDVRTEVQVINSPPEDYSTESAETLLGAGPQFEAMEKELHPETLVPSTGPTAADIHTSFALTRFLDEGGDDVVDGTMADPVSSSPAALQVDEDAIMAYPATQLTQHPISPERRTKSKEKKAKPLNTAALQNLLPKKRQRLEHRRRKSEYDFIEVSDEEVSDHGHQLEDEDEDELNAPPRRRAKSVLSTKQSKPTKGRQSKASAQARKIKVVASRNSAAKKAGKVYGKAGAANNQENNNDDSWNGPSGDEAEESILPDISMSSIEAMKSRELQEAAKKFAEIDDWEGMEFESDNEHRSSSQGWR